VSSLAPNFSKRLKSWSTIILKFCTIGVVASASRARDRRVRKPPGLSASVDRDRTRLPKTLLKPEQYEVKPAAGSIEPSRFYIIEPLATETGYSVQVRRVGDKKVVWRCSTTFETSAAMNDIYGGSLERMIELAKYDLDRGFIK